MNTVTAAYTRTAIATLLAAQFAVFEWGVLVEGRLGNVPGGTMLVAVLGALVYLPAFAFAAAWRPSWRRSEKLAIVAAVLLTCRYYIPSVVDRIYRPGPRAPLSSEMAPKLVAYLRELSAAQEQYRVIRRSYADSADSLWQWVRPPAGSSVTIERHADAGWSGLVTLGRAKCTIWVRDSTLRTESWQPEGSPTCGTEKRSAHQAVRSVVAPSSGESGFADSDVVGEWVQHRVDATRSGVTTSSGAGFRWTTAIGGELRASVAVAGNQVFIGAHGNGEFVALSLDSGKIGFRIRVPNWVHHEPVVTRDLVIVGLGNSEPRVRNGPGTGSAPNGVAAYDRRTGVERWHRYTRGAVMASPVVRDSLVAVMTNGGEAVAWRVADGTEIWRTRVHHQSPMSNPLQSDTLMFVGFEPAGLCALDVRAGRTLYCRELTPDAWGGGHTSPTLAGDAILLSFHEISRRAWWSSVFRTLTGIAIPGRHSDPVLASLDIATGRERWRVPLGPGVYETMGHIAGTPVVQGGLAYLPVPGSGRVVGIHTDSGRVIWSTEVRPARGSVLFTRGAVLTASADGEFVVLDASTGSVRCRQKLPGKSDRAGLTLAGETGVLTLRNGLVLARPIGDWLACRA